MDDRAALRMKTVFGFEETFPEPGIGLGILIENFLYILWIIKRIKQC